MLKFNYLSNKKLRFKNNLIQLKSENKIFEIKVLMKVHNFLFVTSTLLFKRDFILKLASAKIYFLLFS